MHLANRTHPPIARAGFFTLKRSGQGTSGTEQGQPNHEPHGQAHQECQLLHPCVKANIHPMECSKKKEKRKKPYHKSFNHRTYCPKQRKSHKLCSKQKVYRKVFLLNKDTPRDPEPQRAEDREGSAAPRQPSIPTPPGPCAVGHCHRQRMELQRPLASARAIVHFVINAILVSHHTFTEVPPLPVTHRSTDSVIPAKKSKHSYFSIKISQIRIHKF